MSSEHLKGGKNYPQWHPHCNCQRDREVGTVFTIHLMPDGSIQVPFDDPDFREWCREHGKQITVAVGAEPMQVVFEDFTSFVATAMAEPSPESPPPDEPTVIKFREFL